LVPSFGELLGDDAGKKIGDGAGLERYDDADRPLRVRVLGRRPGVKQLVLASSNPGKLREFGELLAPLGIEVVPQGALGVPDAGEPHATFVENALAKARHAKLPALADEPKSDQRNNEKLVALLKDQPDRRAHYYCVVVLVRRADDPEPLIAEGRWKGEVIDAPRGAGGFGYDPYFLLPDLGRTAAEIEPHEKHVASHRGKALRRLLAMLREQD
jgi:XTP/dITP diphosphohydrolase